MARPAVTYVLGTTAGGTGRHVAMLARGCLAAGAAVSVLGPPETRPLFAPDEPGGDPAGQEALARPAGMAGRGAGLAGPAPGGQAASAGESRQIGFAAVRIAERPRPGHDVVAVMRLRGLLRRARPDVVHAHGLRAGALTALALAPAWPGSPELIVTVHNAPPAGRAARVIYRVLERVVARRAATVACVSGDLADRMRGLGAQRTAAAVVPAVPEPPPAPEDVARAAACIGAAGRPVLLAVGRLTGQKGLDILLAAAAGWQDRRPCPLLVIAGDGPLAASLAASAAAAGIAARFLGQRADVPALLAAADMLVLPSRWEGQPLLLQEALRAGIPIVASRVGGVPDLTGSDGALLVPPEDPAQLAAAVRRVLDDPGLARRLGSAAAARAACLPTPDQAVTAAIAMYAASAASFAGLMRDF
jgi:glycosyltransferase involved in cell wall biosynthesis